MKKFAKILLGIVAFLALSGYGVFQLPAFGGRFDGQRLGRMQHSPEFIEGRFQNTPPQKTGGSIWETLRLYRQGQIREPQFEIPVMALSPAALSAPASDGLRATWFGHSSVLVEIEGVRLMTDPVLSDVVSPVPIGPRRLHASPIELADLPGIDAVLISHDHYDHLDMKTIQHLASQGTHYSGRKRQDNSTLWASWVVKGAQHSFYFSGDTGYAEHFRVIRTRFGATDLNLIKIGAYGTPPSWLDIHMDPEAAIRANQDLGGGILLPVHWATFNLSYHAWDEPILRTLHAAAAEHVQVVTPRVGEVVEVGQPFNNVEWYKPAR